MRLITTSFVFYWMQEHPEIHLELAVTCRTTRVLRSCVTPTLRKTAIKWHFSKTQKRSERFPKKETPIKQLDDKLIES